MLGVDEGELSHPSLSKIGSRYTMSLGVDEVLVYWLRMSSLVWSQVRIHPPTVYLCILYWYLCLIYTQEK